MKRGREKKKEKKKRREETVFPALLAERFWWLWEAQLTKLESNTSFVVPKA